METVIVTYRHDLLRAYRAATSIAAHNIGNPPNTIHVVVNDDQAVFKQAQDLFESLAEVYHCTDISTWMHARSGWWSQQWLKLQAHQLIAGEWYMPFDSDMYIDRNIRQKELFDNNRAYCNLRDLDMYNNNQQFKQYIVNACLYWNIKIDDIDAILRESPPNILHQNSVKNMLNEMKPWIFGSTQNSSIEFFLYWIYLLKNNLTDMYTHKTDWFWFGDTFFMDNT